MKLDSVYIKGRPGFDKNSLPRVLTNPRIVDEVTGALLASYLDLEITGIKVMKTDEFQLNKIHQVPDLLAVIGQGFVFVYTFDEE